MKRLLNPIATMILFVLTLVMVASFAFAQDAVIPVVQDTEFLGALLASIGSFKGLATLGVVALVVQLLIQLLGTSLFGKIFKQVSGATKLTIFLSLSLIGGVVSLMSVNGLPLGAALVHASTLSAFGVLANQIFKQYIEKKA